MRVSWTEILVIGLCLSARSSAWRDIWEKLAWDSRIRRDIGGLCYFEAVFVREVCNEEIHSRVRSKTNKLERVNPGRSEMKKNAKRKKRRTSSSACC